MLSGCAGRAGITIGSSAQGHPLLLAALPQAAPLTDPAKFPTATRVVLRCEHRSDNAMLSATPAHPSVLFVTSPMARSPNAVAPDVRVVRLALFAPDHAIGTVLE